MSFLDRFKRKPIAKTTKASDLVERFIAKHMEGESYSDAQRVKIKDTLEKFTTEYMAVWQQRKGKGIAEVSFETCEPCDGLLDKRNPLFDPFMNPLNGLDSKYEIVRQARLEYVRKLGLDKIGTDYFELIRSAKSLAQEIAEANPLFAYATEGFRGHRALDSVKHAAFRDVREFAQSLDERCIQLSEQTASRSAANRGD